MIIEKDHQRGRCRILNKIKRKALHLVHLVIVRIWVHPLESIIIPRLESAGPNKINSTLLRWFSWCANAGRILVLDLRVDVFHMVGQEWSATYFGDGESLEAIRHILFNDMPRIVEQPRSFLWQVPALVQKQTADGNLVVCELNQILKWSFDGLNTTFVVPRFIKQVLEEIDTSLDEVLGSMNQNTRRNIRKLDKQGFTYAVSRDIEDFDHFYHRMYIPYITSRHEGQGMLLDSYESTLRDFKQGQLFLIMEDQDPVCGMICELRGDQCVAKQMGVLDADFDLVKRGVNFALWWFMLLWAREQGAKIFDFGSSRAQTTDGVFNFKRQWGTRVILHNGIHTHWRFYAQQLPENIKQHLNRLGLITNLDGRCYRMIFDGSTGDLCSTDMQQEISNADKCGLAGVALISKMGAVQTIASSSESCNILTLTDANQPGI